MCAQKLYNALWVTLAWVMCGGLCMILVALELEIIVFILGKNNELSHGLSGR